MRIGSHESLLFRGSYIWLPCLRPKIGAVWVDTCLGRVVADGLGVAGLVGHLLAALLVPVVVRLAHRLVHLRALLLGLAVLHADTGGCSVYIKGQSH